MKSKYLYSLLFFIINSLDILTTMYGSSLGGQEKNPLMWILVETSPWLFFFVKAVMGFVIIWLIFSASQIVDILQPDYKYRRKVRALYNAGSFLPSVIIGVTVLNNFLWILAQ